jgi:diguanylate cyclase (GGDEF)-like protein
VFMDVDHFKEFNDRFGHPDGDEALRAVASALRRCATDDVLVARYGGEEFACFLPGADVTQAVAWAERVRADVAAIDIRVPGVDQVQHITISAGVASGVLTGPDDSRRLLRDADLALYQAKHEGRNRVRSLRGT